MSSQSSNFLLEKSINIAGELMEFSIPKIIGILNITPDSFSDGGEFIYQENKTISHVEKMIQHKVDIIDVGGFSTRPYAKEVSIEEEKKRVLYGINCIRSVSKDIPISVDTFRSEIAEFAILKGANIINDVFGGEADDKMFEVVSKLQVPYVLNHSQGFYDSMQDNPNYKNVVYDVNKYLQEKIECLSYKGCKDIIVDLGIGYGKSLEDNYELLRNINVFKVYNRPLLIGVSRKSLITKLLDIEIDKSLPFTSVLNFHLLTHGANLLRVHDVEGAKNIIKIFRKIIIQSNISVNLAEN